MAGPSAESTVFSVFVVFAIFVTFAIFVIFAVRVLFVTVASPLARHHTPSMDDEQLTRYSRHMALPGFGRVGQQQLLGSSALVMGLGGLGSPAAMYLAASGVGRLVLVDFDVVELSNLQRQIVHLTADLGRAKVESAHDHLRALNPDVTLEEVGHPPEAGELAALVAQADVVIDGSDNFETRFELNAACVRARTPLVSGAALQTDGQVSVFDPRLEESPCYRCLYQDAPGEEAACADAGVLSPLLGIVGSIQASEALKVLLGLGTPLIGRLLLVDAASCEFRTVTFRRDPRCPVCSAEAVAMAGGAEPRLGTRERG